MTTAASEPAASAAPEDTASPAGASKRSSAAAARPSSAASDTAPSAAAASASPDAAPSRAAGSSDVADLKAETADITAGPGGVMTDEVGVITGDLTLRTELAGDKVTLRIQYKDADEWYVVTGGRATLRDPADLEAVHKLVVGILHRPEG